MFRALVRCVCCAFILASAISAFGQNARITGQVTDPQGAAIQNAQIQATNLDTTVTLTVKSDGSGAYTIPYLTAGQYRIIVQAPDFSQSVTTIPPGVGQAFIYNVQLTVGSTQSSVNVDAGASSVSQVNTENAEISGTVTGKEVSAIQLNGRNYTQLIALTPGVSNQTGQDEAKVGVLGSVSYSVNGGRVEYNSYQVDGSETLNTGINKDINTLIVYPSIDAIQEIKILTSNYGAQYPSTGNATTIVTTKSGTDTLHGSLYEFLRNEAFNAKGYFDVTNGPPLYRRNDFGGTIGGPVVIPHLYNGRGKTHFFFSEEARLELSPTAFRQGVPSLAERAGDFSDVCPSAPSGAQVPLNLNQYPDCPHPPGVVGDLGGNYGDYIGTATFPGNNLVYGTDPSTGEQRLSPDALAILNTGIDIAGNNAAYGGYGFAADTSYMPWQHSNPVYSIADNLTKVWRKHNFQFGAQAIQFERNQVNGPIGAATGDVQGLLIFSNESNQNTTGNAFADFLATHVYEQPGDSNYNPYSAFGGDIADYQQDSGQGRYYQRYKIVEPYFQDDWKITPRFTVNLGLRMSLFGTFREKNHNAYNWVPSKFQPTAQVDPTTGVLLGQGGVAIPLYTPTGALNPAVIPGVVQCGVDGVPDGCMTGHLWNPSPRVGFAWDASGNGKMSIRGGYGIFFEHGTADEANSGSLEASAPLVLSATQYNPPSWGCIGYPDSGCTSFYTQKNLTTNSAFPVNITSIPTKAVWPYVQQWSASVERQLPWNSLLSVGYVGSKGTHLTAELQSNQLPPAPVNPFGAHQPFLQRFCQAVDSPANQAAGDGAGFAGDRYLLPGGAEIASNTPSFINMEAACYGNSPPTNDYGGLNVNPNALRQYAPGLGQIYSLQNIVNSNYNALQILLRRTKGPLFFGVAYTYSHSLDDASDRSDTTMVNSYDLHSSYASSNYDQRHLLHISYVYDFSLLNWWRHFASAISRDPDPENTEAVNPPPSAFANSGFAKSLLNGWELSGLTLFETGTPFTVINGGSANGVGVLDNAGVANGVGSGSYPDLIGNPHGHHASVAGNSRVFGPLLLNPGAFAAPRALTFGSAGRNVLNNPSRTNFDIALQKNFAVPWHESSFVFRAEAFNAFNHTQFRIYDPLLGNQANNTVSCYADSAASGYSAAGDASTDCTTGNAFLHPVDAHRPRTLQFALKYAF